jgi:hypothetical protein
MAATLNISIEYLNYLVNTRRTKGYLSEGFSDWESFFTVAGPAFRFGQPKFVLEMMDLIEQGELEALSGRVQDKILSHTLERVNQGDN